MTYEELTPDERKYYNRLDPWRKERYLKTIHIVRGAMEAVDAGEKGLPHPRLINWQEKRLAWEERVLLAEERRIAREGISVASQPENKSPSYQSVDPRSSEMWRGRFGAIRSD